MSDSSQMKIKTSKKTLDDFLSSKEVITGKEVIQNFKEQEKRQKEFEKSMEDELRHRRFK
jgi:hypothetical protein